MTEEKNLDLKTVAEDAAEAERVAEEASREQETGSYTHTFKNPFQWKGRTFECLTFDWTVLKGRDHLEIEQELIMKGRTLVSPAFTGDFLAGMAARACTERDEAGKRVIDGQAVTDMPMADFQTITRKARGFLLRVE
ncbi:MAG: hypothetical protein HDT35_00975 [Clostridiales bacterium]|nr:hypothetical protein [Clostridiales bacterium]